MRSPNSCEKQLKYSAMVEGILMWDLSSVGLSFKANKWRILLLYFEAWWGPAAASATWIPETSSTPWMSQGLIVRGCGGCCASVPGRCLNRRFTGSRYRVAHRGLSAAGRAQSSLTTGGTVGSNRYGEKPCGDAAAVARTRFVRAQERSWQVSRAALNDCQGIEPPSSGISIVLSFTASPIHSRNSSLLPTTAIGRYPRPSNG